MSESEQMLADCETREGRLSDWERGFVDSIQRQLASGRTLTEKQEEQLELIWEKATANG